MADMTRDVTPDSVNLAADEIDPTQRGEATPSIVEEGLGSSRYKEYDYPGYAQVVRAHIPSAIWSGVLYSWLSYKGHLLSLHDFDRTEFFVTQDESGDVDAVFVVVWAGAEALAEWLEHGYSLDLMLTRLGIPEQDMRVVLMRDFS